MANKNINGTNLVIGPNTRVEAGEIKKLEINGEDIPLSGDVVVETNKAVTITDAGSSTLVEPDAGYDALAKVTISASIKLYMWAYTNAGSRQDGYTLTEVPSAGDKFYYPTGANGEFWLGNTTIDSYDPSAQPDPGMDEGTIVANGHTWQRDSATDIIL